MKLEVGGDTLWPRQVYGSGCSCPPSPTSVSHVTAGLRTVWHLEETTRSSVKMLGGAGHHEHTPSDAWSVARESIGRLSLPSLRDQYNEDQLGWEGKGTVHTISSVRVDSISYYTCTSLGLYIGIWKLLPHSRPEPGPWGLQRQ